MRKLLLAASAVFAALAGPVCAQEAFVGVFGHDVTFIGDALGVGAAGKEDGMDIMLGVRSQRWERAAWLGKPKFYAMVSGNTSGDTSFVSGGLAWPIDFGEEDGFYFQPALGLAYQDGYSKLPDFREPGLTPAELQRRIDLREERVEFGSKILFQPELTLGYRFNDKIAAELSWVHLSHGQILASGKNEGLDDVGVRLVYSF
ncbi:acyloxyacyl hydrolase [Caulobacter sp. NIBR2454]|uniref:acyloxyacyl hydrolase n=1 Tax=Caulobacter sp. NIBR2454 TaxID=3015996 RepID=UPI0022B74755|nr:acyloxyacyl hydrolase [Caulobacter sp. NIBR2454]